MQREYLILTREEKSFGAVKVQPVSNGLRLEIDVERTEELDKDSVFKAYIVYPLSGETEYLGVLEGYRGEFTVNGGKGVFGVAVTRKNTALKDEKYLCCCSENGRTDEVEKTFREGKKPKKEADEKEEKATLKPKTKAAETDGFVKEYLESSLKKLEKITEGFTSEKVNGYYLRSGNRIIRSVMSNESMYKAVMRYGYYIFSVKSDGDSERFIVSVPVSEKDENPFCGYEKYAFKVKSDIPGDINFYCIAAGSDSRGDFFLKS